MPALIGHSGTALSIFIVKLSLMPPEESMPVMNWRSNCPLSCALDVLGDKWSLLIVRDLFIHGSRTYSEFSESPEKISTNILAARLKLLTHLQLIKRVKPDSHRRGNAYELTDSGRALEPLLMAYGKWASRNLNQFNPGMTRL